MVAVKTKEVKRVFASAYLFPVAVAYAALILPWAMLTLLWQVPAPAGLYSVYGHAHELLAGYALLVIAGYLLGRIEQYKLRWLIVSWAASRLSFLGWPDSALAVLTTLITVGLLAYWIVPRFAKSAKKWRNKSVAPLLLLLFALAFLLSLPQWTTHTMLVEMLLGLCLLMFFMGGRVIAPAVAGHLIRQDIPMPHRVQPKIEGAVILLFFAVLLLFPLPVTWGAGAAGALLCFSGLLIIIRMLRWQLWRCTDRPDLLLLSMGYGWLALGVLALGAALLGIGAVTTALHAITVGALGTLTATIMARTHLVRRFRDPNASTMAHWGALFISLAAVVRVVPPALGLYSSAGLFAAALLWCLGFVCMALMFWRSREN